MEQMSDQIYLFKCILTKCSIGIFFIKQEHKLGDGLSENQEEKNLELKILQNKKC